MAIGHSLRRPQGLCLPHPLLVAAVGEGAPKLGFWGQSLCALTSLTAISPCENRTGLPSPHQISAEMRVQRSKYLANCVQLGDA